MLAPLTISSILLLCLSQVACHPLDSGQTYLASAPRDCVPKAASTKPKPKASSATVMNAESKADREAVDKFAQVSTKLVGEQKNQSSNNTDCESPSARASMKPIAVPNEQLKSKQLQAVEKFGQEAK